MKEIEKLCLRTPGEIPAQDLWLDAKLKLMKPYQILKLSGIVLNFLHFVIE